MLTETPQASAIAAPQTPKNHKRPNRCPNAEALRKARYTWRDVRTLGTPELERDVYPFLPYRWAPVIEQWIAAAQCGTFNKTVKVEVKVEASGTSVLFRIDGKVPF